MNTICICGGGTMGSGIAQATATAGYTTVLFDVSEEAVKGAGARIAASLQLLTDRQKLTGIQSREIQQRLHFTTDIADCRADLIIEAIIEKMDVKQQLFNSLAAVNETAAIFASNTSSLSISALAQYIPCPQRVAGLHFFNPAPVMKLVEVVKGEATSEATIDALTGFTRSLGKVPVVCKDAPGFIVNRVARPYYLEALRLAEQGLDFATIDNLLQAAGFKLGPFHLMDLIGNDINYAVSCSVYEQLSRPGRLKPSAIQKAKVEKGELGRKSGKGYFEY